MSYLVKQFQPKGGAVEVTVPASKSILNRALVLAALAKGRTELRCGPLCEDTRALLSCLHALGIGTEPLGGGIAVHGCGGDIPNKDAALDVQSAGTAARFLPSVLAFCGGDYRFTSSAQMQKRPMEFLKTLQALDAKIDYEGEEGRFPFRLRSEGIRASRMAVDTDVSTQYASGLLLASYAADEPTVLQLSGGRTQGSYIGMTLALLRAFGAGVARTGEEITVTPARTFPASFEVEGDLSGACYFFALALLHACKVLVRGVKRDSLQGDAAFLERLEDKGLLFQQTAEGLLADGSGVRSFTGFTGDFSDFSDQTATAAALAPFATTPSRLANVGHIRYQECDRVSAIVENILSLGGEARAEGDDIVVLPRPLTGGTVKTFGDHRIAMAFAVAGSKSGNTLIDDPACVNKTFEDFWEELSTSF